MGETPKRGEKITMTKFAGTYIVNDLPVKIVNYPEQETFDVIAYNFQTGQFERNFDLYTMIAYGREDIRKVSEVEFEAYVNSLRKKINKNHE
jgi:hypothetical protein